MFYSYLKFIIQLLRIKNKFHFIFKYKNNEEN